MLVRAFVLCAVLAGASATLPVSPATAQTSEQLRAELEEKQAHMEELSARVETAVDEYHEAHDRLRAVEEAMRTTADEVARLRADHDQLSRAMRVHARRMHMLGPTIELSSVLVATDPSEAGSRSALLRRILGEQVSDLEQLTATRTSLTAGESRLDDLHEHARTRAAEVDQRRARVEQELAGVGDTVARIQIELDAAVSREEAGRRAREQAAAREVAAQARRARSETAPVTAAASSPPARSGSGAAVDAALSRIGMPYRWGATGPGAFDCSGLMVWAWREAGVEIGYRSSAAQFANLPPVAREDLRPGDLVYAGSPRVHHVGMYVGGGRIVHSPHSGATVQIRSMERRDLRGFRRPA